ncbi:pre-mRNA-splicing factor 38 [Kocuria palustris]|nr:pre-mRNA-splicing factor 38 [Kocuria palustris]
MPSQAQHVEKIVRDRIVDGVFYKQHLHGTNEATILPVIVAHVDYIGGTDSQGKPLPFLCCLLRLLEINPSEKVIFDVYMDQLGSKEFKYVTALVLVYIRLVLLLARVYQTLEPFYLDYRKLRLRLKTPQFDSQTQVPIHFKLTHIDELVDDLLTKERVFDIHLPRLVPRLTLLERGEVEPRQFAVVPEDDLDSSDFASDSE